MKVFVYLSCLLVSVMAVSCSESASDLSVDKEIGYCQSQALKTLTSIPSADSIPNSIDKDAGCWRYTSKGSQGLSDESMWARGQAWAIYGFTMSYRETQERDFLEVACQAADTFLSRLPADMIPYWDFDDASTHPFPPKDASAAAVTASALLELSQYAGADRGKEYYVKAIDLLKRLSSSDYQARSACPAFLLHSVGHKPHGTEVDSSISYADYYYLEALLRLKTLQQGNRINGF